jgi:hypothetical protein
MYYFSNGGVPNNKGFNALPDYVQKQIIENMMYGGSMARAQYGSSIESPMPQDYPNYESFKQALDNYNRSMSWENLPLEGYQEEEETMAPSPNYGMTGPSNLGYSSPYKPSLTGYLSNLGLPSDRRAKNKLAKTYGFPGYVGTNDQDLQLLNTIINDPSGLTAASSSSKASTGKKAKTSAKKSNSMQIEDPERDEFVNNMMAAQEMEERSRTPYMMQPEQEETPTPWGWLPPTGGETEEGMSEYLIPAGVVTGAGLGTYAAMRQMAPGMAASSRAGELAMTYVKPDNIIKYVQKFGRDGNTFNILRAKGMNPVDIQKALKGVKFNPNSTAQIMSALDISQSAGKQFNAAKVAINAENLAKAQRLVEVMKLRGGVRDPKLMQEIYKLVPNPAQANSLMKGLALPKAVGSAAKATSTGSKVLKGLKAVSNIRKGRFFPFEEGGELDMYQDGNEVGREDYVPVNPYQGWGQTDYPDTFTEDLTEIFEPTGGLSWDDLQEIYADPNSSRFDKALGWASVIPLVGEIPRGIKGLKGAAKYILGTEKAAEKLNKIKKAGEGMKPFRKGVAKTWQTAVGLTDAALSGPFRMTERMNPAFIGTGALGQKLLSKSPKGVQKTSKFLGNASRFSKEMKGFDLATAAMQDKDGRAYYNFKTPQGDVISIYEDDPRTEKYFNEYVTGVDDAGNMIIDTTLKGRPINWKQDTVPQKKVKQSSNGLMQFKKDGGYTGTWNGNQGFAAGGTFIPGYGESAYGLPQYEMGRANYGGMYQGGGMIGDEMEVTPEQLEMLRQQGYQFDII